MTSFPNFENNLVDDGAENIVVFSVTEASGFEIKSGDTRKHIFVMKSISATPPTSEQSGPRGTATCVQSPTSQLRVQILGLTE